jgi:phosphatidylglycerophosphate synthase
MVALILDGTCANTDVRQSLDPSTPLGGLSLVERAALAALRAGVDRCVVVGSASPHDAAAARLRARGASVSFLDWNALRLLDVSDGALVIRACVLVEPRALAALLDRARASDGHTVLAAGGAETDPDLVVVPPGDRSLLDGVASEREFLLQFAAAPLRRQVSLDGFFCRRLGAGGDLGRAEIDYIRHQNGGAAESFFTKRIRQFSVPLSRVLVRRGATPTQVTLAGLVLAIMSAMAVSVGTYAASLVGALLYYASMVFDCSDGEVARLSFRDSAFGAWLETLVDYASYFLLLGALVLGSRHRESAELYQQAAVVALAGSILIAAVAGYLRHRVAGAAPGEFDDASAAALANASPFHRFARWGRQWIKRSTIAHLVVALALVNQLPSLIYLWAFGAVVGSVIILGVEPFIVQRVKVEAFPQGGK